MDEHNMSDISNSSSSSGIQQEADGNDTNPSLDEVRAKLIRTAEMDRLFQVLDMSLSQCGWETDVQNLLRVELRKNENLTLEELFEFVREKALSLLPDHIEQDMIERIQESYAKDLPNA